MLKQKVIDLSMFPNLGYLRQLVVRNLGALPRRLDVFQLIPTSTIAGDTRYALETDGHVTPGFRLREDYIEIDDAYESGGVGMFDIEEAAQVLARELAEVA
jgi:hypothetical protein